MKKNNTGAIILCGTLTVSILVGGGIAMHNYNESKLVLEEQREFNRIEYAKMIVNTNATNNSFNFDTRFINMEDNDLSFDDGNAVYVFAYGKDIYDEMINRNILYCKILDEYYTKNGNDIALYNYIDKEGNEMNGVIILYDGIQSIPRNIDIDQVMIYKTKPFCDILNSSLVGYFNESNFMNLTGENGSKLMYHGTLELRRNDQ